MKSPTTSTVWLLVVTMAGAATASADLERDLEARLKGAWAVATVELYSTCSGVYTNNHAGDSGVASRGNLRFEPGELVKVDKLSLKRAEVHLFLGLAEPVLVGRTEGPFQLFDERSCRVQLILQLDRAVVAAGNAGAVLARVGEVLEVHPSLGAAQTSSSWNQRQRDPYPEGYELTLARLAVWRAEQTNAAVAARSDSALNEALRGLDRLRTEPAYLEGFATGVERARSWSQTSCGSLVEASFSAVERQPPKERSSDRAWSQGYRDGQELTFNLLLVDRLQGCFVPVPLLPGGWLP